MFIDGKVIMQYEGGKEKMYMYLNDFGIVVLVREVNALVL